MNHSEQTDKIAAAMVNVQSAIKPASKTSANPFFKSKYADLSEVWHACHEALSANGVAVIQGGDVIDGQPVMVTTLLHTSGQWLAGAFPLVAVKPDPQAMGSAITYMRRYSLAAMVGVLTEDDDGEGAMSRDGGGSAKRGKETAGNPPADSPPPARKLSVDDAKKEIAECADMRALDQWVKTNSDWLYRLALKSEQYHTEVNTLINERTSQMAAIN